MIEEESATGTGAAQHDSPPNMSSDDRGVTPPIVEEPVLPLPAQAILELSTYYNHACCVKATLY